MTFTPTAEQTTSLDLFLTGKSLAIQAGAGTGKTSDLMYLAANTKKTVQYVAFNRAIVDEAGRKFPGHVNCATAHSLARRAVGHRFAHRIDSAQRMRSLDIANVLRIDGINVTSYDNVNRQLSRSFLAGVVMKGIKRFCQTADLEPSHRHVPLIEGLDDPMNRDKPVNRVVARALVPALKRAWADLTREDGSLTYTHDHYLKLWHLSGARIGAEIIMFDEAQDANPVMQAIVLAQTHAQLVWVGDSQQQIYSFTGAVNALANIDAAQTAYLTQSFRFGQAIADVANTILERLGAELRLTGTPTIASVVAPISNPGAILCRTNATAMRAVLRCQADGQDVHLVGGGKQIVSFAKAARDLMAGRRVEHPDLACFESWGEVREYVDQDEQGGDLRLMVNVVDEFGVDVILAALDRDTREEDADVVVSTAHKAKGREWDTVQLGGDFPEDRMQGEELRLLYVAVTRARRELDITNVPYLREGYVPGTDAPEPVVIPPRREVAPVRKSEHVGRVGDTVELTLTVTACEGKDTRYGHSFVTQFTNADGDVLEAFLKYEVDVDATYDGTWTIAKHAEWRGQNVTRLNRPTGLHRIEQDSGDASDDVSPAPAATNGTGASTAPQEGNVARDQPTPRSTHDCLADDKLVYVAAYGAPGIGEAWRCTVCDEEWAKVGGTFHDPSEGAHILSPEDVI